MNRKIKVTFGLFFILVCLSFKPPGSYKYELIVFTGSDWCAHCRRLEKTILSDSVFLKQMEINSIGVEKIDFPQRKKLPEAIINYNSTMAEKFSFDGSFPTLILTRTDLSSYQKINYTNQSIDNFLAEIKTAKSELK